MDKYRKKGYIIMIFLSIAYTIVCSTGLWLGLTQEGVENPLQLICSFVVIFYTICGWIAFQDWRIERKERGEKE